MRDQNINLFFARGMRGGISVISKHYAKASNPLVERHDTRKPTNYITYLDAINLYRWAMGLPLPKSGFEWKRVMPTEEQIQKNERIFQEGVDTGARPGARRTKQLPAHVREKGNKK